jgi:hypothetical protein
MPEHVYRMVPAGNGIFWVVIPVLLLLAGLTALMCGIIYSSRRVTIAVSAEGIRVRGDIYGRLIPAKNLLLDEARAADLTREGSLAFRWKTNGAALPGYKSGWFKLANGVKALAFVTDQTRVAYIPTSAGYTLLVSVEDPNALIANARADMK